MDWYILKVQSNREDRLPKRLQRKIADRGAWTSTSAT